MLVEFLHSVDRLEMKPEYFQGNIAVIGQGQAFPERALLTIDRFHGQLNPDISLLACFDAAFFSNPELLLDTQVVIAPKGKKLTRLPKGSVVYYPWSAKGAIDRYRVPSHYFDTVLAFQIVDLSEQLQNGLLQSIVHVLKHGGFFIGCGGMSNTPSDFYESITNGSNTQLRLIQKVRLSDFAPSGYPFTQHTGVILQKI